MGAYFLQGAYTGSAGGQREAISSSGFTGHVRQRNRNLSFLFDTISKFVVSKKGGFFALQA
jgi:hypothetical protein